MTKNNESEDFFKNLKDSESFEVSYNSINLDTKSQENNNVLWTNRKGCEIVHGLFCVLKEEFEYLTGLLLKKQKSRNKLGLILNKLFSQFKDGASERGDFKEHLGEVIEEEVRRLKAKTFIFKDKKGEVEISVDQIKEMFLVLRERRIEFYKWLLKEYKNNKENFDKKLEKVYSIKDKLALIDK